MALLKRWTIHIGSLILLVRGKMEVINSPRERMKLLYAF